MTRFHWPRVAVRAGFSILLCLGLVPGCGSGDRPNEPAQPANPSAAPTDAITDTATAAGHKLEIVTRDGRCVLHAVGSSGATQDLQLAPQPPCHFLRLPGSDAPRSLSYADVNTEAVLIVSGTPASENTRRTWGLEPGLVCGEESQGVLVRNGAVLVTRAVRRGGVTCRDKGVDEKEYSAFAHDEK
jgi:hypothetical protein